MRQNRVGNDQMIKESKGTLSSLVIRNFSCKISLVIKFLSVLLILSILHSKFGRKHLNNVELCITTRSHVFQFIYGQECIESWLFKV